MKLIKVEAQPELAGAIFNRVFKTGFIDSYFPNIDVYLSGDEIICRNGTKWRTFDISKCRSEYLEEGDANRLLYISDWRIPNIPTIGEKEAVVIEQLLTFFFQAIEARVRGPELKQAFQEAYGFPLPYEVTINYVTGGLSFRVKVEAEEKVRVKFQQVINELALTIQRLGKAG